MEKNLYTFAGKIVIAKCTIPKTSKFIYEGYVQISESADEENILGYASSSLIIDKIIG